MPDTSSLFATLLNSELVRWLVMQAVEFWRERRFNGTYIVNTHEAELELLNGSGSQAVYNKTQTVTFTQDGVFAIQDQAWGDGDIFASYACSPGVAVDRFKEGYRWKILISLRSTRNCGETERFCIQRTIRDGFTAATGNFQTQLDHPTKQLTMSVIFPKTRQPKQVMLIEQNAKRSRLLRKDEVMQLSGGRTKYICRICKPRLYEGYILRWEW